MELIKKILNNIEIHHNGVNRSLTIVYGENHITVRITDQGRFRIDSNLLLEGPPIDGATTVQNE